MLARHVLTLPASSRTVGRWGTRAAILGGLMGAAYYLVWTAREAVGGPMAGYSDSGLTDLADLSVFFSAQLLCILGLFGVYAACTARYPPAPAALAASLGRARCSAWSRPTRGWR